MKLQGKSVLRQPSPFGHTFVSIDKRSARIYSLHGKLLPLFGPDDLFGLMSLLFHVLV